MKHARRLLIGIAFYGAIFAVIAGAVYLGPWSGTVLVGAVLLGCSYAVGAAWEHYR